MDCSGNSSSRKVRHAVIPIAGIGSRLLPASKSVPKELLPVLDRPIIHYIVDEAVRAGIECVVFVTARSKVNVLDYFDPNELNTLRIQQAEKEKLIEETIELSKKIDILSVRQNQPKGLGHAVWTSKNAIGDRPFAVLLGDDLMDCGEQSAIKICLDEFEKNEKGSVIGVIEIDPAESASYGVIEKGEANSVKSLVEKPEPAEAPSNLALPGRYVFGPEIFSYIEKTRPGKGGEIQLTDAMQDMLATHPIFYSLLPGHRYDTGTKLNYIKTNIAYALKDPRFRDEVRRYLNALEF